MNQPDETTQDETSFQDNVDRILYSNREPLNEQEKVLLEEYKLFVETSEKLVARRQTVNNFFLSVNILVCSGIGVLIKQIVETPLATLGVLPVIIAGILLCCAWLSLLNSYKQLNIGKFDIIHRLEQRLPAALFKAEWETLGSGKDNTKYRPFTKTERAIPIIFIVFYALAVTAGIVYLIISLCE